MSTDPDNRDDRRLRGVAISFVLGLVVIGAVLGFIVVPLAQGAGSGADLWATMCRALGITPAAEVARASPAPAAGRVAAPSQVAWTPATLAAVRRGSAPAGETVARTYCIACHLADGSSPLPLTPRLAGQSVYAIYKQLHDYKSGTRAHPTMTAMAALLGEEQMADVAAYYAGLPFEGADARTPSTPDEAIRTLVLRGDSTRTLPPCVSCHALGTGGPLESPTLNGQYRDYLALQLQAYAGGMRRNDLFGRMRSVSRALTAEEIDALATYYGRER